MTDTAPSSSDNANRSLIKVNQILFETAGGAAQPNWAPSPGDNQNRSLIKINSLLLAIQQSGGGIGVPEAPTDGQLYGRMDAAWTVIPVQAKTPFVRVRVANDSLNAAVANNAALQFDTIDSDTNGFAATSLPIDRIVLPPGLGGLYLLTAESSSTGNQSTTMGLGVAVNGQLRLSAANQFIKGPASVSYGLTDALTQLGYLNDADYIQLLNTSVSGATNPFTNTFLALARLGGL